jgi:hypothetical protein
MNLPVIALLALGITLLRSNETIFSHSCVPVGLSGVSTSQAPSLLFFDALSASYSTFLLMEEW